MGKLLDKDFYSIRAELCETLFPKGEDAYPLHEILVMDKLMSLIALEKRALDVFEYYYKKRVIFPDGGIYFFGRKYYLDEKRLIDILITVLNKLGSVLGEIPNIKEILENEYMQDLHEEYYVNNASLINVNLADFKFVDGFIIYKEYVCPHPLAKRNYSYISVSEKKTVNILLGHYGNFDFYDEQDKEYLLNLYKLSSAKKVLVDINNITFEDGFVLFNPNPALKIYKSSRIKLKYSKSKYDQYKNHIGQRNITVTVSGGKVVAFTNRCIIDCIKTIRKTIYSNRYVKALLKVDSLTEIFSDIEINKIFGGDNSMTQSIKMFRTTLAEQVKFKTGDLSRVLKAIRQEALRCNRDGNCLKQCNTCKLGVCFRIMLSHISKYPILVLNEPNESSNESGELRDMIVTVKNSYNANSVNIIVQSINEPRRKAIQVAVSRFNYYKVLFMVYTYFTSPVCDKRKKVNLMRYLKPFGVTEIHKIRY